ncbi:MAG: helix-turn-helix transcriptional regulator [bacterium]|nr:helix-turn-helix transcriptional regulator [bacterium]
MANKYLQNKQILQNKLAEIIRTERIRKNKSISLISNEVGMTKSMWADMERGIKDPQFSTLFRMLEGLEIPLDVLASELQKSLPENFSLID